ncbi:hypothetical protein CSUNSWCD_3 [Campylobacter showae CSUNSWCD]|uniref:Uncharacterized protein n=1 Tax=Campylobacter showae CSUNSWCD TaxID=1244083 RepID=M5IST3_9BACT|nr:hypothetical protein CSUNSWCD_3 [Campylobacter showae CSUNSWCD]
MTNPRRKIHPPQSNAPKRCGSGPPSKTRPKNYNAKASKTRRTARSNQSGHFTRLNLKKRRLRAENRR